MVSPEPPLEAPFIFKISSNASIVALYCLSSTAFLLKVNKQFLKFSSVLPNNLFLSIASGT